MTEPHIKDTILRFFLDRKGNIIQSNVAAEMLGLTEEQLIKYSGYINVEITLAIEMNHGGMHYKHLMGIRQKEISKVEMFLDRGGFAQKEADSTARELEQRELNDLLKKDLDKSIKVADNALNGARTAEKRAKRAEIFSAVSMGAAVVAAIAAVAAAYFAYMAVNS